MPSPHQQVCFGSTTQSNDPGFDVEHNQLLPPFQWNPDVDWGSVDAHLHRYGFAVVDRAVVPSLSMKIRHHIEHLYAKHQDLFHANHTILTKRDGSTAYLRKHQIDELDLHELSQRRCEPNGDGYVAQGCLSYLHSLAEDSHLLDTFGCDKALLKAQLNHGDGACFPMHVDSSPQLDSRVVTAILYLNDIEGRVERCPRTRDGDEGIADGDGVANIGKTREGGALRLYPFPYEPLDVSPALGRLVLFSSTNTVHRVLPAHFRRVCITLWLTRHADGQTLHEPDASAAPVAVDEPDSNRLWQFLFHRQYRHHIVRLVYADEWAKSILESHPDTVEREFAIAQFWKEHEILVRVFGAYLPRLMKHFPVPLPQHDCDTIRSLDVDGFDMDALRWID